MRLSRGAVVVVELDPSVINLGKARASRRKLRELTRAQSSRFCYFPAAFSRLNRSKALAASCGWCSAR